MKISKTKSGKYTAVVHINDLEGKRHTKRFTAPTSPDVLALADEYLQNHSEYMKADTFGAALDRYIDRSERYLSPSTIAGYKSNQTVLKKDYGDFCGLSCDRIRSAHIQEIINDMKHRKKSAKTIRNRIGLISAVLTAEGFKMPSYNAPQAPVPRFNIPDEEIITKVSKACTGRFERMRVPLGLACFSLRRGEICAVTADDLDGNILHITRAVAVDYDGNEVLKDLPKNEQSVRAVLLPDELADEIREKGRAWEGSLASLSHSWPHLCRNAGVEPFRLHDCRHFFVSYCHDVLKLSDAQIMKMGGWKTDSVMKRRYRHSIADDSAAVVDGIGSLMVHRSKSEPKNEPK